MLGLMPPRHIPTLPITDAAQAGAGGGRKAMCPRLSRAHNRARRVLRGETLARSRPMHGLEARVHGDYRGTGGACAFIHESRFEVGLIMPLNIEQKGRRHLECTEKRRPIHITRNLRFLYCLPDPVQPAAIAVRQAG